MIQIFEGRIGGGKTLTAVDFAFKQWLRGGLVASNIEFNWNECFSLAKTRHSATLNEKQLLVLDNDKVERFWEHTPTGTRALPVLVIIDEADVWVDSRDTMKGSKTLRNFLKQSRKMNTDIIFITQNRKNIDVQIQRLVQYIWKFRDMQLWRIKQLGIGWPLPQILQIQLDHDGKTEMNRRFWTKDTALFKCYNTDALYDAFTRLDGVQTEFEVKKDARKIIEFPLWTIGAAAALVILAIWL